MAGSLRLDARGLDLLGPIRRVLTNEPSEMLKRHVVAFHRVDRLELLQSRSFQGVRHAGAELGDNPSPFCFWLAYGTVAGGRRWLLACSYA